MKNNLKWTKEYRVHKDDEWLKKLPVAHQCSVAHDGRYLNIKCNLITVMEETMQALKRQVEITQIQTGIQRCD